MKTNSITPGQGSLQTTRVLGGGSTLVAPAKHSTPGLGRAPQGKQKAQAVLDVFGTARRWSTAANLGVAVAEIRQSLFATCAFSAPTL